MDRCRSDRRRIAAGVRGAGAFVTRLLPSPSPGAPQQRSAPFITWSDAIRHLSDVIERVVLALADLGPWAPVLFILAYILASVTLAPAFLLTFAAGAVFGLLRGTLLVYVG